MIRYIIMSHCRRNQFSLNVLAAGSFAKTTGKLDSNVIHYL